MRHASRPPLHLDAPPCICLPPPAACNSTYILWRNLGLDCFPGLCAWLLPLSTSQRWNGGRLSAAMQQRDQLNSLLSIHPRFISYPPPPRLQLPYNALPHVRKQPHCSILQMDHRGRRLSRRLWQVRGHPDRQDRTRRRSTGAERGRWRDIALSKKPSKIAGPGPAFGQQLLDHTQAA